MASGYARKRKGGTLREETVQKGSVFELGHLTVESREHPATDTAPALAVVRLCIGDTYTSLDRYEAGRLARALELWSKAPEVFDAKR